MGATLAEVISSEQARCPACFSRRLSAEPLPLTLTSRQEVFSDKPLLSSTVSDPRYGALNEYLVNHTRGACATAQLFAVGVFPLRLATTLGWNLTQARVDATGEVAATTRTLAAFGLTPASVALAQAALRALGAASNPLGALAGVLGVSSPALDDAIRSLQASPLNETRWSLLADAAVAALLDSRGSSPGNASSTPLLSVSGILAYNGPLPIPSFDEFVLVHQGLRTLFERYEPAWQAYRAIKDQTGINVLGNLLELGGLAFTPDTPAVRLLASTLAGRSAAFSGLYHGAYDDVAAARQAATAGNEIVGPWAVVVFDELTPLALRYTIRMRFTLVPGTDRIASRFYSGLSTSYLKYYTSGFLSLQRLLDEAALDGVPGLFTVNATAASVGARRLVWGTPFPVTAFVRSSFFESSGPLLGMVMCLSMVYPFGMLIKGVVEERETGMRELMRVSGLCSWALGAAWSVTYTALFLAISVVAALILQSSVFVHCSAGVLWGMLFLFMLSCIPLAFLVASFFARARLASIFGPFALFALLLPRYIFFRTSQGQALGAKRVACLLAPSAFTFAADNLGRAESASAGVTASNVWEGALSVGECMAWLVFDTLLYAALAWTFEQGLPDAVRSLPLIWRLPWSPLIVPPPPAPRRDEEAGAPALDIEPPQTSDPAVVVMRRLSKTFVNGVHAVDGLDLELHNGILVILGHNGAGKTTAISMLTGMLRPTSGSVTVCGVDVSRNRAAARGLIGACPQHNVLYGSLSVLEHLRLFAVLKGVASSSVDAAADALLSEVGLEDKAHALAFALSGGMKRRLQLACALVGGSRVILLDEPSSGMDVISRRQIWDLLRRVRVGRCICLTTHFLDEADLLADRVAVLSEGRLRAAGSPLFLKQRLGGGFTLSVTSASPGNSFEAPLRALVASHAPDATLLRAVGGELAWQLSPSERGFAALLGALESERDALGIGGFAISSATLEEVFLRLAGEAPATLDAAAFTSGLSSLAPGASVEMATIGDAAPALHERAMASCLPSLSPRGAALLGEHSDSAQAELDAAHKADDLRPTSAFRRSFVEMLRKRALIARRDYKSVLSQVALPTLAVALVLLILTLDLDPTGPRLVLSAQGLAALGPANATQQTPVWYPAGAAVPGGPGDSFTRAFEPACRLVPVSGADAFNGTAMSYSLLRFQRPDPPFRFGAYVPGDVVVPRFTPGLCLASLSPAAGALAAQALMMTWLNGTVLSQGVRDSTALVGASALLAAQELAQPATNVMHNTSSPHALPLFVTELRASQLRQLGGPELSAASFPLPLTPEETTTLATFLRILAAFFVLIPYSYLPATYAAFVVRERAVGAKLQLFASGCHPVAYWLAAFVSEMLNQTLVVLLCMILFAAFNVDVLVGTSDKAFAVFLLLMLYGTAATPLSFCHSFLFDNHAAAQVAIATFGFVTGFCLTISSFILGITPQTVELNKRLVVLFRIFPGFLLGEGLLNLATASFDFSSVGEVVGANGNSTSTYTAAAGAAPRNSFGNVNLVKPPNAFEWNVLGRTLLLLLVESAFFFLLTLLIELRGRRIAAAASAALVWPTEALAARWSTQRAAPRKQLEHAMDPGVVAERERLQSHELSGDAVELRGLHKEYPPRGAAPAKVAVADLWLGVARGSRLGLLGENGAGKTTTLAMLCCDVAPSAGDAFVGGYSVLGAPAAVQRRLGYCPQRDPLLDLLTVREHLQLYARLKGVPEHLVAATAEAIWRRVGLGPFADRLAGTLSGGNKRKLSLGVGIIGSPSVLLCDEPSSGLDPQARRNLWDVISASTSDMAVILTTHSLDEAEALCHRIAIVVSGSLRCIGSSQMLKERYGEGHVLDVKAPKGRGDALVAHLAASLPLAVLSERHAEKLRLTIPRDAGLPLSRVVAVLQDVAAPAENWAVTPSSLDAVFCAVAATAHGEEDARLAPAAADLLPAP